MPVNQIGAHTVLMAPPPVRECSRSLPLYGRNLQQLSPPARVTNLDIVSGSIEWTHGLTCDDVQLAFGLEAGGFWDSAHAGAGGVLAVHPVAVSHTSVSLLIVLLLLCVWRTKATVTAAVFLAAPVLILLLQKKRLDFL